jgi:hypothetical protein
MTQSALRRLMPADLAEASALAPMATRAPMTVCATCGQTFDMRKLALAYHHGPEPHDPL